MVIEDTMFYWCHRTLHTPWFYKRIHKVCLAVVVCSCYRRFVGASSRRLSSQIHHQYNVNIALASEHAHPIELIVGNLLPVAM